MKAISLFSGCGGFDVGFINAGFKIQLANDIDTSACATYRTNHSNEIINAPIANIFHLLSDLKNTDVVFGGPPCQGFSVAGRMNPEDERNKLIWDFFQSIELARPYSFVMENVKSLASLNRWKHVINDLVKKYDEIGYQTYLRVLTASDYGVPQTRERMFLFGFRKDFVCGKDIKIDSVLMAHRKRPKTIKEIFRKIGKAGTKANQNTCKAKITFAVKPILRKSPYAGMLFNGQGRPINPNGFSSTLPASMGGNRTPIVDEDEVFHDKKSWIEDYHMHLMNGGCVLKNKAPERLRRITITEAAKIQDFPDSYKFAGHNSAIYTQIGNAVPCGLAGVVAEIIKSNIK